MTTHTYSSHLVWEGSTAGGYRGYSRSHRVVAPPAQAELTLSADPHFRGDSTQLNPEQLLVMAASSCQLLSFLALAARHRVDVRGYQDQACGIMSSEQRPARIEHIELSPRVRVGKGICTERVEQLLEQAHEGCYIANSLTSSVTLNPTVITA